MQYLDAFCTLFAYERNSMFLGEKHMFLHRKHMFLRRKHKYSDRKHKKMPFRKKKRRVLFPFYGSGFKKLVESL